MGTVVGVLIGVVVTVFVSRYYFQRSVSKSLGVYGLLNSFVFSGIAADVRNQLNFRFKNREVRELQQLVFLIANDGEKAIRDVIEPLGLAIPKDVEVLDVSIVHRFPDNLKADLVLSPSNLGSTVTFHFPVLNRREFFVVKLLLSGRLTLSDVEFTLLADDLPRTLSVKPTPPAAIADSGYSVEWGALVAGGLLLSWLGWFCYWGLRLREAHPELFPYPWSSFVPSVQSAWLIIPAVISILTFAILGIGLTAMSLLSGQSEWQRGPRFPLPQDLREAVFPYQLADLDLKPSGWAESQNYTKAAVPFEPKSGIDQAPPKKPPSSQNAQDEPKQK